MVPKLLGLAPESGALIEVFNKLDTGWPNETSPQRLEEYKAQDKTFREKLKVQKSNKNLQVKLEPLVNAFPTTYCVKLNCYRRPPYCFIIAVTELACAQTAATAAPELSLSVSKGVRGSIRDK
jgi:hypothetical protein